MSDHCLNPNQDGVPIKVDRIFDSCSDKDCLNDLPVTLSEGKLPPDINIVRSRAASVENVCVNVEPIPFNKGFYSIDLSFTFKLEILGYANSRCAPVTLTGTAYASKNCILYGSESSVRSFTSLDEQDNNDEAPGTMNLPTAIVSVLEPIVLETKLGGTSDTAEAKPPQRNIFVTLGLFSVVELTRPVTIMVPTLDYSIPQKDCCSDSDSPCEVFGKLKFPEEEFSPSALLPVSEECDKLDEQFG